MLFHRVVVGEDTLYPVGLPPGSPAATKSGLSESEKKQLELRNKRSGHV